MRRARGGGYAFHRESLPRIRVRLKVENVVRNNGRGRGRVSIGYAERRVLLYTLSISYGYIHRQVAVWFQVGVVSFNSQLSPATSHICV